MCTHRAAQSVFITMTISPSDHSVSPPNVLIPRDYNAAADLLGRHASRKHKPAYIDGLTGATLSYAQLSEQAHRFAQGLQDQGFVQEQRVLLCMHDSLHWPVAFLGCILAGVVPIAVNTLLTTQDYHFMLRDSRAQGLIISQALWPVFEPLMPALVGLKQIIVDGGHAITPGISLADLLRQSSALSEPVHTLADDVCFWLYSSGSTGSPKGTLHLHSHVVQTAELYGRGVLGLQENDVVFSAAKLFFAYGLGNALSFPLAVGATTVLLSARPTPTEVFGLLKAPAHRVLWCSNAVREFVGG